MIFAAGLGTRLQPLTLERPKALVETGGKPLLAFALEQMKRFGIREVVVNVHHFAEQITDFLQAHTPEGLHVLISDERELLLDTGGGLRKAAPLLKEAEHILLWNVDVIADIDFQAFAKCHRERGGLATLAVSRRNSSRQLLFTPEGRLGGWKNLRTGEEIRCSQADALQPLAFSGIHLVRSELLNLLPDESVFSIIKAYLSLCGQHPIHAFEHPPQNWVDAGKIADLPRAAALMQRIQKKALP